MTRLHRSRCRAVVVSWGPVAFFVYSLPAPGILVCPGGSRVVSQPLGCQQGNCRNAGGVDDDVWCHPPNISCRCTGAPGGVVGSSGRGWEFEGRTHQIWTRVHTGRWSGTSFCLPAYRRGRGMDDGCRLASSTLFVQPGSPAVAAQGTDVCPMAKLTWLTLPGNACLCVRLDEQGMCMVSPLWARCLGLARLGHYSAAQCK